MTGPIIKQPFLFTWLFPRASQNFDSMLNLLTLVHKYPYVAGVDFLLIVDGSTVLFKAYIGALDVISGMETMNIKKLFWDWSPDITKYKIYSHLLKDISVNELIRCYTHGTRCRSVTTKFPGSWLLHMPNICGAEFGGWHPSLQELELITKIIVCYFHDYFTF